MGCQLSRNESIKLMNAGLRAERSGLMSAAIERLKEATAVDPTNDRAYYFQGIIYRHRLQRPEAAVSAFREAIAVKRDEAEYHYQLGDALTELGRREDAVNAFGQALVYKKDHGIASLKRGRVLEELRRFDDAQAAYRLAIQAAPYKTEGFLLLANLYRSFGQLGHAAKVLENASENHPQDGRLYREVGQIYSKLKQPQRALRAYERSLQLEPGDRTLHLLIGQQLYALEEYRRAEIELKAFNRGASADVDLLQKRTADLLLKKIRAWKRRQR